MANDKIAAYFENLRSRIDKIPEIVANEAVNYFLQEFDKAEFDGTPWPARKKDKDPGRHLLVSPGGGALRRGIRVISSSPTSIIIGNSVTYARVHNDGLEVTKPARQDKFIRPRYERGAKAKMFGGMGAFRKMTFKEKNTKSTEGQKYKAYSFQMPQRRFIGNSVGLRAAIRQAVISELKAIS